MQKKPTLACTIPYHLLPLNQQTAVHRFTGAKTGWKQLQKIFLHNNLQHNQFQISHSLFTKWSDKTSPPYLQLSATIHVLILAMFNSTIRILFKIRKDLVAVTMIHNLLHPWTK